MKLSFGNVLSESFGFFFGNLRLFFHLVTIPWIISLLLRVANSALGGDTPFAALIEKALDAVPTVMFMTAWMRVTLLGTARLDRLPGLGWSGRETAVMVHLLQVAGMTFVLIAAFMMMMGPLDLESLRRGTPADPELAQRQALAAPLAMGFIVSAVLALRVCFGLAASAVDVPFTPRHSWAYSRGNAWTIIGLLFLILIANAIATMMALIVPLQLVRGVLGADTAAAVIAWASAILVSYGGVAIMATAQAVIFRNLTGWRDGAPLAQAPS